MLGRAESPAVLGSGIIRRGQGGRNMEVALGMPVPAFARLAAERHIRCGMGGMLLRKNPGICVYNKNRR
ncbi:protein of unknown function [Magnetospirillum sp. XM-1]|nr:protein of unknown function [Magnetospirillum sp. XM-1]